MPGQSHIERLALNDRLVNRAAWKWLKEAKAEVDPYRLHLLTLAWWGWDNGVRVDRRKDRWEALELQLGYLSGWKPEDVMSWLCENPDGPGAKEQEESLLIWLKGARSPLSAAAGVLEDIWSRQQAAYPALR
jgi:hypothetical protein